MLEPVEEETAAAIADQTAMSESNPASSQDAFRRKQFFYNKDGKRGGPVKFSEFCELYCQGDVTDETPIWYKALGSRVRALAPVGYPPASSGLGVLCLALTRFNQRTSTVHPAKGSSRAPASSHRQGK